jgi:hypothetical protein
MQSGWRDTFGYRLADFPNASSAFERIVSLPHLSQDDRFSNAAALFSPDAVRRHVAHYADPRVGRIGGDLIFVNTGHSPVSGSRGAYWRYERHLRLCDSSSGILA